MAANQLLRAESLIDFSTEQNKLFENQKLSKKIKTKK